MCVREKSYLVCVCDTYVCAWEKLPSVCLTHMCVREKSYLVLECTCLTCNVYIYMYHLIHPLRVCLLITLICLSAKKLILGELTFAFYKLGPQFVGGQIHKFKFILESYRHMQQRLRLSYRCSHWLWRIEPHNYANARDCFAQMASFSWAWRYCWQTATVALVFLRLHLKTRSSPAVLADENHTVKIRTIKRHKKAICIHICNRDIILHSLQEVEAVEDCLKSGWECHPPISMEIWL